MVRRIGTLHRSEEEGKKGICKHGVEEQKRNAGEVRNTKEKLITELMKKVYREFKCPVFCTGLALLIAITSKTKRHTSGALQREGIDTQWCGAYRAQ